ncbi:rod shape-determining protein [Candidatus Woesebacteria bacterium]|nr:rod shape-determining protein [Candidatus Woesebacteria bacterium]MCD8507278.1 rod shape-determining protein [Candidatus Woesebacteria bacterium]MCD8527099.1 rod shape-determining protein [Candidatus Woesebacteria bacterium]MCD8546728.1 rod shape-determining protein [Candidatus Woesebacteria bacterium]
MFQNVWQWWQSDVFVVPTATITYVTGSEGAVYRVPTRILVEMPSYKIVAFGDDAREVEHAGLGESKVIKPFGALEVFDEVGSVVFLRSLFRLVLGSRFILKPHVVVSLSDEVSPFMQEVWQQVAYSAGARQVTSVHPLLAVAAGAGLPHHTAHGYAVGIVDSAGIAFGLVAFGHVQYSTWLDWESIPEGDELTEQIQEQWQRFLSTIPVEFMTTITSEGCVLAWEEAPVNAAHILSPALETPMVVVPRTVEVLGLRSLRE